MRVLLINPSNSAVTFLEASASAWTRFRVWKPLGLMVLAGLTPRRWDVELVDENLGLPDYDALARPDLVGITAFTSQVTRAYELAAQWRARGVPVVMGGIHATMCAPEALEHVDSVVKGEAESVWSQVLADAEGGKLARTYEGTRSDLTAVPPARHDVLTGGYHFGSIQTSRGCPLNCSFCSVTAFNGGHFRRRPTDEIIAELRLVPEKHVLIVDDNFIGIKKDDIAETKTLLRAMIAARLGKRWVTQVTINMADDPELLALAAEAGCTGVFIGFETISDEGMAEISKKASLQRGGARRDFPASVRAIQRHGIVVLGSFIIGLEVDQKGIGEKVAQTALDYGVDILNAMYLTPLPGTRLWNNMQEQGRIAADRFPEDWKYYTLTFPVARYQHLSWSDMVEENSACNRKFYSPWQIARRVLRALVLRRHPLLVLVSNLSYRLTAVTNFRRRFVGLDMARGPAMRDAEVLSA